MRLLLRILCVLFLFLLIVDCAKKPKACPTCNGTGKITSSEERPLPAEIVECNVADRGVINPDYLATVTIENKGDKDGMFTVFVDFHYKDIGTHTEKGEVFVRAHSRATTKIRYDADKLADSYECRGESPVVIQTKESICPTCNGSGLLK